MKKIILVLFAAVLSAGVMSAQDMAQATETYNSGATALADGDKAGALEYFQQALQEGLAVGDEASEIVSTCQNTIPKIYLALAKDSIKASAFDESLSNLDNAIATAKEYGVADIEEEASALIPQIYMQQGNAALKAKDVTKAAEAYKKVIELDATNAAAYLRLGSALNASGDAAGAEEAFLKAAENGMEKDANKQLSNMSLKAAQAALKAGKSAEAIEAALKSAGYNESANAYKIAAAAAQKLGKDKDMVSYYEKYLELAPNAKDAAGVNFTIAATYQKAGDKAKAKEYYNKVLTDPTYGAQAKQQVEALNK